MLSESELLSALAQPCDDLLLRPAVLIIPCLRIFTDSQRELTDRASVGLAVYTPARFPLLIFGKIAPLPLLARPARPVDNPVGNSVKTLGTQPRITADRLPREKPGGLEGPPGDAPI
jgi:hypothetical protein